ncbi:MAG TPA: hypothetical protein VHQ95_12405 [Pyrinomonadaceae bacterium]|nr:hypothetical protein [Pyrinomonadaceae bacterium]
MSISSGERCANREAVEAQSPTLPKAALAHHISRARSPVRVATIGNRNPNVALRDNVGLKVETASRYRSKISQNGSYARLGRGSL